MGTWGVGTFEDDNAADWAIELAESEDGLALVEEVLRAAVGAGDDYLEAPDGQVALAAAEVVARLKGHYSEKRGMSEPVDAWVIDNEIEPSSELVELALSAIDRVLTEPSELLDLWSEGDPAEWIESVKDLRGRVGM